MLPSDSAEIERFVELGSTLNGKYRIDRVLGVGGMGAVVAAQHLKLGESVAIKFLLPRALGQARQAQRFLREARAASRIRSSHVARVFDVDVRADGAPFIVMEYLTGETLGARLKRDGKLEVTPTIDDLLEACEAIAEAHSLGIVHRDLKPANLFLARGAGDIGLVKVLDFGISKLFGPDSSETESTTGEGFVGSPPYMSPEQLTDPSRVDLRSDIWAIGLILYECLTGKGPFKADNVGQVLALVLQGNVPSLGELRPDLPRELVGAIECCMSRERDARYPDVLSLARALAPHASERGRRALAVIEAVSVRLPATVREAASSEPPTVTTGPALDTGTLSAAAEGPRANVASSRRAPGTKVLLPLVALGVLSSVVFALQSRRATQSQVPSAGTSDGAVLAPSETAVAPTAPTQSEPSVVSAPSAAPSVSTKPKIPKIPASSAAPAVSRSRQFDPVFDERR